MTEDDSQTTPRSLARRVFFNKYFWILVGFAAIYPFYYGYDRETILSEIFFAELQQKSVHAVIQHFNLHHTYQKYKYVENWVSYTVLNFLGCLVLSFMVVNILEIPCLATRKYILRQKLIKVINVQNIFFLIYFIIILTFVKFLHFFLLDWCLEFSFIYSFDFEKCSFLY